MPKRPITLLLCAAAVLVLRDSAVSAASTKPAVGRACKVRQIGTKSGLLVCTKSGKAAVWRTAAAVSAATTTVLDITNAPVGTVIYRANFDDPAKPDWVNQSGPGLTGEASGGQFRLAASPPALGRVTTGALLTGTGRTELAFDMTLTPGAASKASVNITCQDTGVDTLLNFLLIDIRTDGRIAASRYDNLSSAQQPTTFFDRGFSNQDRFDPALMHPRTRVALRCIREGQNVQVSLSLDGTIVMNTTTPALTVPGDGFIHYMSTFSTGFRDAAELLIDNVTMTKV